MKLLKSDVYSVSKLNSQVRQLLEGNLSKIWLTGEISNFATPTSGHWYLTLKDNRSQIRCAMFKGRNQTVTFRPTNGQQVLVKGNISVYEPRGDYQLLIDNMQPAGDGLLAQEYEALKMTLAAQGLFAANTKKSIPDNIARIGIITSPTGAAIKDILHVLNRRDPSLEIIIYPSQVQGKAASINIINAIAIANQRHEVDVLLITRGGGSLEDLWCFNDEALAYAIYQSNIPTISAVGHEIDTTISDYVADLRAPTPSAAAEILSKDKVNKAQKLQTIERQLSIAWQQYHLQTQRKLTLLTHRLQQQDPIRRLEQLSQRFDELQFKLHSAMAHKINKLTLQQKALDARLQQQSPVHALAISQSRLDYGSENLKQAMMQLLHQAKQQLEHNVQLLNSVSPLATLARGYSITTNMQNKVIDNNHDVAVGETITTQLHKGKIVSKIISKSSHQ